MKFRNPFRTRKINHEVIVHTDLNSEQTLIAAKLLDASIAAKPTNHEAKLQLWAHLRKIINDTGNLQTATKDLMPVGATYQVFSHLDTENSDFNWRVKSTIKWTEQLP